MAAQVEISRKIKAVPHKIGFIGGGQMAMALAKGFMATGLVAPSQVLVSAPSDNNLVLWRQLNASTTHDNIEVIRDCEVIFLAVKPHIFVQFIEDIYKRSSPASFNSKLFISVMAGITIKVLEERLSSIVPDPRVVRANPNTPVMIGCGASAFSLGQAATSEDAELVSLLLGSAGMVELIPEYQQNAFTGLVTSGPAYIYTILEGLADGGVRMGLPRNIAIKFAAQMALGAAKMSLDSGKHTGRLKDEVTSPAGTTIRGVHILEKSGVRGAMMDAVQAAAERAEELGDQP